MKMSHELWMKDTAAFARQRSTELQAVDQALKSYELALQISSGSVLNEKKALQEKLERWKTAQSAKGQDWHLSVRNKLKSVETLDAELGLIITPSGGLNSRGELMIDPEELRARRLVAEAVKHNTRMMFTGQRLTIKNAKALADVNAVRSAMSTFKTAASKVTSGAPPAASSDLGHRLRTLLTSLFGEAGAGDVEHALGPVFMEFLSSATPFLGVIKSGGQAISKWGQAAKGLYSQSKMKGAERSFAAGDPAAAFDAIVVIQDREIVADATSASIYTAGAAAKAAFTAADFGALSGPLLGAAETFAIVVQKIYLFARDWNETKSANALLDTGALDLGLFKASPLLGCYLVANSDTSSIINMAVGDYGRAGWKFEVEVMVKKAQPVFEKARSIIRGSRFEIVGMRGMKGTVADRTATTLGVPTGKLGGMITDISTKIKRV
jgi:hypothetical protein